MWLEVRVRRNRGCVGLLLPLIVVAGACSGSGDGGGDESDPSDFCTDVRTFEALQAEGDALFEQADVDPARLRDVFTRFSAAIDALESSAPDEVASDVRLVGETTQQLIDAYERADYDFVALATDPQYAEVLASLDEARVTEANDRLAADVRERCGDPAPVTTGTPGTTNP